MQRPANTPSLNPNDPHSAVYLAARREWNERYGSYIAAARTWRLVAFASLGVAAVAVGGVVWQSSQSRVVPYVVEVNKLGDELPIERADLSGPLDPRIVRAQLARFVTDVRSVYIDVQAERAIIGEAYAMVDKNGPAFSFLNDHFAAHSPFTRAADEMIAVHVDSVIPLPGGNTWRAEWREDTTSRDGRPQSSKQWEATITVSHTPPITDADIRANATGLFVESMPWGERQVGR